MMIEELELSAEKLRQKYYAWKDRHQEAFGARTWFVWLKTSDGKAYRSLLQRLYPKGSKVEREVALDPKPMV